MKNRIFLAAAPVLFAVWALYFAPATAAAAAKEKDVGIKVSKEGQACIDCHESQSPSFVKDWKESRHARKGVDCYTCHRAEPTDADAKKHYGFTIAVLVTPKDCGKCHAREVKEFTGSHHAKAGDILNSLDNYLGEVVAGPQAVTVGCIQCHGSKVRVLANGSLDPASWPNTGIGRINSEGSRGSALHAIRGTASPSPRRERPRPAASATWVLTIPRWRSTWNRSTASSTKRRRTS